MFTGYKGIKHKYIEVEEKSKMIDVIVELVKLKVEALLLKNNKEERLKLYESILAHHPNKDVFMAKSEELINHLSLDELTDDQYRQWIVFAMNHFGMHIAMKIYDKNFPDLIDKEIDILIECYRDNLINKNISAFGIYAVSQLLNVRAPMKCYELTKEAFEIDPDLAQTLGIEGYRYEGKAAEENISHECPFCGEKEKVSPYYCSPQINKLKNRNTFPPAKLWIKCNKCNNFYTYNFPLFSVGDINGHYTGNGNNMYIENHFDMFAYGYIFNMIKLYTSGRDYFEIGIGTGEMMAAALEYGYNVQGVEICRQDCDKVSSVLGVEIACCDIVDFETDKKYDVIIMGDVFEHTSKPVAAIEKISNMLKEDGVLWLSTPNYNCGYARMQGFSHCMWHELNHYTYSSYETVEKILNDFGMETVHYSMSQRYIGSMELIIKKKSLPVNTNVHEIRG